LCTLPTGDDPSAALAFADTGWRLARVYGVVKLDTFYLDLTALPLYNCHPTTMLLASWTCGLVSLHGRFSLFWRYLLYSSIAICSFYTFVYDLYYVKLTNAKRRFQDKLHT
jgi:hypothetical protein